MIIMKGLLSIAAWSCKTLNKHEIQEIFPVGIIFISDVLKCIEENFKRKLLLEQVRLFFSFSVCSYFSRHWVAALARDWRSLPLALGCEIPSETPCVWLKVLLSERYEEKLNTDATFQTLKRLNIFLQVYLCSGEVIEGLSSHMKRPVCC